jgi:hypothetical protein
MVTDEELKKLQWNAKRAVEEGRGGIAVTLAMDPVVMFSVISELLRLRQMSQPVGNVMEGKNDQRPG